jgi:hypothetical protein
MSSQMNSAATVVRQAKFLVFPALLIGGWLTVFGSVVTAMGNPQPLRASIEQVLDAHRAAEPTPELHAHR